MSAARAGLRQNSVHQYLVASICIQSGMKGWALCSGLAAIRAGTEWQTC